MGLSIYHTHTHSLGRMSERGKSLSVREREIEAVEIILLFSGFTFGADSIFEEVEGFLSFMVSPRKILCVSCLLCFIGVHVILLVKDPNIIMLA